MRQNCQKCRKLAFPLLMHNLLPGILSRLLRKTSDSFQSILQHLPCEFVERHACKLRGASYKILDRNRDQITAAMDDVIPLMTCLRPSLDIRHAPTPDYVRMNIWCFCGERKPKRLSVDHRLLANNTSPIPRADYATDSCPDSRNKSTPSFLLDASPCRITRRQWLFTV